MGKTSMTFRELIKNNPELRDINYKEHPVSKVLWDYGYYYDDDENVDCDYSDYKAYHDLSLGLIDLPSRENLSDYYKWY